VSSRRFSRQPQRCVLKHKYALISGFSYRLPRRSWSSQECRSTTHLARPRTSSSMAISIGRSKVAGGISGRAGTDRGRSSNQRAFQPRSFKSPSATIEYLLPGGRNGVVMRHRGGSSTMGATGTKRPTNGSGASARIAGHGTKVKKVKKVKAVHQDSPSKDVARRVVEAQAPVGAAQLKGRNSLPGAPLESRSTARSAGRG
jgi:hypothetical protein